MPQCRECKSWESVQLPSCLTFMLSFQDVLNPKVM